LKQSCGEGQQHSPALPQQILLLLLWAWAVLETLLQGVQQQQQQQQQLLQGRL
jgi:hypothetical protein